MKNNIMMMSVAAMALQGFAAESQIVKIAEGEEPVEVKTVQNGDGAVVFEEQVLAKPPPKPEKITEVTVKHGSNILTIARKGKPERQNIGSLLDTAGEGDTIAWPEFQATAKRRQKGNSLHWVTPDGTNADGKALPHGDHMAVHYTRKAEGDGKLRIRGDVFVSP